jgi:DNA invertase Pin-like site-specific DNA recombinase
MPLSVARLEANRQNAKRAGRKRKPMSYADVERLATIGRVLKHEDGAMNQKQTAAALHISPRTLGRRIAEWRRLDEPW